jgi:SAM-dependent methyltransferase
MADDPVPGAGDADSGALLERWLCTPQGQYLLAWEQARVDTVVADLFGFHALQLGLGPLDALRGNRMPHRWRLGDRQCAPAEAGAASPAVLSLMADFDALPFPAQSIDLVVLPHTLEFARDAHHALREVERVLVPEGRVVIFGFNAASLWGLRQRAGAALHRLRACGEGFLPREQRFIGYWRLRDWLRLLSFELEGGRFGCYAWPVASPRWLCAQGWMDRTGDRWWPVFGAVYSLVAVKRVRGMRLVGLARDAPRRTAGAPAVVANRHAGPQRELNPPTRTE